MRCVVAAIVVVCLFVAAQAGPTPASEPSTDAGVVLTEASQWRASFRWLTPLVRHGEELKEAADRWGADAVEVKTPPPAANWKAPDFADSGWARYSIRPEQRRSKTFDWGFRSAGAGGAATALVCLRGRFNVDNPGKVHSMTLALSYRGGVVVYLNGQELARGSMPAGPIGPDTLADEYPHDCFVNAANKPIRVDFGDPQANPDGLAKRIRTLSPIVIPPDRLRKGTNVLALEFHRTAYFGSGLEREGLNCRSHWSTCGLVSLELRADPAGAATPNTARPPGVQAWATSPASRSHPWQWSDPNEGPGAVAITGCRNGSFTGKVMVSSGEPLKDVKARMSDLRQADGKTAILASQVGILYSVRSDQLLCRYSMPGGFWDTLVGDPPAEVPVAAAPGGGESGAIQPIVLKVRVPAEAAPGDYEGELTVESGGQVAAKLPIRLRVMAFRLPEPRDYATLMGLVQSPDSVAMQYRVAPWSDEHFALMEQSFRFLGEIGNNYVCLPLIAHTNFGNEQSMLRWTRDGDKLKPDLAIFNRYLDLAAKYMNLRVVQCYVWDRYMDSCQWAQRPDKAGRGAQVTVTDKTTGKTEVIEIPRLVTPEGKAFWKSAWAEILARMDNRGLRAVTMMGTNGDAWGPTKDMLAIYREIAPGVKWSSSSHADVGNSWNGMEVGYNTRVYNSLFPAPGRGDTRIAPDGRYHGWQTHRTLFPREGCSPSLHPISTLACHRFFIEAALLSNNAGLGRTGLDFWPLLGRDSMDRSKRPGGYWNEKRSVTLTARFPEGGWDQLNMDTATEALLAPGPRGAITTERFEQLREGVQECQARIAIERAAMSGKVDAASVARCWQVLDERQWRLRGAFIGGREDCLEARDDFGSAEKLFRTAEEVAGNVDAK
ncbi:MAG: hypothetical protein BIFFINMI_02166 [Phycisphaerae bacterium]|nr:hypothetical protein [Phycisphaerae bacterium]